MTTKQPLFEVPSGQQTIAVKLLNLVNFGPAQINRFYAPPVPGLETHISAPSHTFLLEHPSGRKLVWDLGIRKDYQNYSPKIAAYIPTTKYTINVTQNVIDVLEENGIKGEDVEAVIWSHWHWDHIGDPSTFPPSTDLVVGPGFKEALLPGAPGNPDSPILESDYAGRKLREINFDGRTKIGQFDAFDYFGDGSFYLLDSPGHAIGHLCGLARTSTGPDTFILLGGDICHYPGVFRPSEHLPVPASIMPHPLIPESEVPFCPGSAWEELQHSRGLKATEPLYTPTFGHDIPLANKTRDKLQLLDADDNVFVIIAHDRTLTNQVPHFPKSLNDWKEKGWARDFKWAFLRDMKVYWESKGLV